MWHLWPFVECTKRGDKRWCHQTDEVQRMFWMCISYIQNIYDIVYDIFDTKGLKLQYLICFRYIEIIHFHYIQITCFAIIVLKILLSIYPKFYRRPLTHHASWQNQDANGLRKDHAIRGRSQRAKPFLERVIKNAECDLF